jgi:hypothetical protein
MALVGKPQKKKMGKGVAPAICNGNEHDRLLKLAKDNPWRLFKVNEIQVLYNIGEKAIRFYRHLAQRDQKTDPWEGDKTRPEEFHRWFWEERKRIEKENPDVKRPQ